MSRAPCRLWTTPDPVETIIAQQARAELAVVCGRVVNVARFAEAALLAEASRRLNAQEVKA